MAAYPWNQEIASFDILSLPLTINDKPEVINRNTRKNIIGK